MQVVRALTNPTRIRILDALGEGPASPRELSARIDVAPGVVDYHLRVLRATGCIQLTEPEKIGPAGDRPYELAATATPTRWLARPKLVHSGPGHPPAAFVQSILQHGAPHRGEDFLGARKDQMSCASIVVDKQGWREISAAIGEAMDRISTAHRESTARMADSEEEGIEATIAVATFESPGGRAA